MFLNGSTAIGELEPITGELESIAEGLTVIQGDGAGVTLRIRCVRGVGGSRSSGGFKTFFIRRLARGLGAERNMSYGSQFVDLVLYINLLWYALQKGVHGARIREKQATLGYDSISISAVVVQLLVYPIGCLWAKVVPIKVFNTFGIRWTFNPGPFTIKEHTVIVLMANVSIGYAYSTDALIALKAKPYYNMEMGWGFQLIFTLSSQLIGIGLVGLCRRFLVWPAAMIWPLQFSNTSLFYALHDRTKSDSSQTNGWQISRYRYFIYVALASFAWYWSIMARPIGIQFRIKPNNVILNQLFGGFTGLSLIPITFDWTYISSYLNDPLLAPPHALVNTLIGLMVFFIIPTIGIAYSGTLYSDYLPLNTSTTYDNTQSTYNVSRILGPNFTFDLNKYKSYSPMFLAPTFALNYGLGFAALIASIVHVALFHRHEIWRQLKKAKDENPDIHMKLMAKYTECPDWWYGVLFVCSMAIGLGTCLGFDSQLPSLNVLSPFIGGYMIPGRPIAIMVFKVYSTIVLGQAQTYAGDMKMAHYMKIPPRTVFSYLRVATIWASFVQIAVMNWTLGSIKDICTPNQPNHFTCPNGRTFFSNSITWGVIGPKRMLGSNSIYQDFQWFWLIGAMLPVLFYILVRIFPRYRIRYLNAPVMLGAMGWLPPATPLNFFTWSGVGLLFNYYIRRHWSGWWHHYNYLTAASLDSSLIISTIIIFLAIVLPNATVPQWWGNVTVFETPVCIRLPETIQKADFAIQDYTYGAIRKTVAPGETFGPSTW
ncbi:hypothetical protein B7463_g8662, partial [Scytalidium lignicola]